jgi:mgtE-like transporter
VERRVGRRSRAVGALTGGDPAAYRDSLIALLVAALASLVAGVTLAGTTGTLERLPGLLLLVPAALAVKGNIFGALGSRLGTSIHAGSFRLTASLDSVVGQNTAAAMALTLVISVVLAVMAKGVAVAFSVSPTMSVADFIVVSTVGGIIASAVVLVLTLLLADASVRYDLDLDNVVAPLVTATGDVISLPALVWAAELAGVDVVTPTMAWVLVGASAGTVLWTVRTNLARPRAIVGESFRVLTLAGLLDLIAGITI